MVNGQTSSNASYHAVSSVGSHGITKRHISGVTDIILNALALTLPMLIFCGVLLGLVFHNRVQHEPLHENGLHTEDVENERGYYYVNISATFLIFVASWSSTIAPILSICFLGLWSFPVAANVLKGSAQESKTSLNTPYQLVLTLGMLNGGGIGSLWSWMKYLWCWRGKRQPQGYALVSIGSALVTTIVVSLLVLLADTWLHVATVTVPFTNFTSVASEMLPQYSLRVSENCTNPTEDSDPCSVMVGSTNTWIIRSSETIKALNNVSDTIMLSTFEASKPYVYIGVSTAQDTADMDFSAETFGLQTQCQAITKDCMDERTFLGAGSPFRCNDVFYGDVTSGMIGNDSVGSVGRFQLWQFEDQYMNSTTKSPQQNPFYSGFAVLTADPRAYSDYLQLPPLKAPDVAKAMHGGIAFVLACQTTFFDISYDWVNGSATRFDTRTSNETVAAIPPFTMAMTGIYGNPYKAYLTNAASLASLSGSGQEIADKMALAYSKVLLALFTAAVMPEKASQAQIRNTILVAKVPVAALYTLVVTNLLFVIAGIVLLITALVVRGAGVDDVQARLSIAGIVADRFESIRREMAVEKIEELFEEHETAADTRVAICRTARNGYAYEEM